MPCRRAQEDRAIGTLGSSAYTKPCPKPRRSPGCGAIAARVAGALQAAVGVTHQGAGMAHDLVEGIDQVDRVASRLQRSSRKQPAGISCLYQAAHPGQVLYL